MTSVTGLHPRTELISQTRELLRSWSTRIGASTISPVDSSSARNVPASSPHATGGVTRRPSSSTTRLATVDFGHLAPGVPENDIVKIRSRLLVLAAVRRLVKEEHVGRVDRIGRQPDPEGADGIERRLLCAHGPVFGHEQPHSEGAIGRGHGAIERVAHAARRAVELEVLRRIPKPAEMTLEQKESLARRPAQGFQELERLGAAAEHRPFEQAFFIFVFRVGVPHDAAADAELEDARAVIDDRRPDGHVEPRVAARRDQADRPRVDAARPPARAIR